AGRDFVFDLAQAASDHLELVSREDPCGGKSRGVGNGSGNVVAVKPPIERDRFAVALRDLGRGGGKALRSHRSQPTEADRVILTETYFASAITNLRTSISA